MIDQIVERFKKGQIIIFPTDTLYGIGCLVSQNDSIEKLYKIKNREADKPTLILVADTQTAQQYGIFNEQAQALAEKFWPGPLTIIVKAKAKTPTQIQGSGNTVAIRVPDQTYLLEVLSTLDEAVLAPSANFSGEAPPNKFGEIDRQLLSLVDYAIDLAQIDGKALTEQASTIVEVVDGKLRVIRQGAIEKPLLEKAFESARRI